MHVTTKLNMKLNQFQYIKSKRYFLTFQNLKFIIWIDDVVVFVFTNGECVFFLIDEDARWLPGTAGRGV